MMTRLQTLSLSIATSMLPPVSANERSVDQNEQRGNDIILGPGILGMPLFCQSLMLAALA